MPTLKPGVVIGGAVLGIVGIAGVQYYTINNLRAVETSMHQVQADTVKAKESLAEELEKVRAAKAEADAEARRSLATMREELAKSKQTTTVVRQTSPGGQEALKSVRELTTRIATTEAQLKDSQSKIASDVSGLKQSATEHATTIAAVTNEVREVRDQVVNQRGQLDTTIADLKRVNGDLGVLSGLIATNGKEIDALKQLGDRNYVEFNIRKGKNAARLGDIWVLLKATNEGKGRYTIELRANDRRLEKKDKQLNEPVQFFVGENRQPHEIVVNQIHKDGIVGYLAAPKVMTKRASN